MSRGDARVQRQCRPAPSHLVLVIFLSLSTSRTWLSVLAELAHRAVPTLAPTIVGRDSVRGRPAERKPQEVVRTTRDDSRALLRSEYILSFEGTTAELVAVLLLRWDRTGRGKGLRRGLTGNEGARVVRRRGPRPLARA